jgi:hypothetical protein
MFDFDELAHWEEVIHEAELLKVFGRKHECLKDPARERLYKRRRNVKWSSNSWSKEPRLVQIGSIRNHRRRMNQFVREEKFDKIIPFQNTRGWLTW